MGVGEDEPAQPFSDLRHYGVAEAAVSVHPSGNPISHSVWFGLRRPVMYVPLRLAFGTPLDPPMLHEPDARGVGQKEQSLTCVWGAHGARG